MTDTCRLLEQRGHGLSIMSEGNAVFLQLPNECIYVSWRYEADTNKVIVSAKSVVRNGNQEPLPANGIPSIN
ncbi:MAG: hypothetical protein WCJ37_10235 [Syntrophus sp. (in: bacteria)]